MCSHHVAFAFPSESTLCSCLNFEELHARNRRDIRNLSNYSGNRLQNHLVHKQTLNYSSLLETHKFIYRFHTNVERLLRLAG